MNIAIVTNWNGIGLETDGRLLERLFTSLGHSVARVQYDQAHAETYDLAVWLEVFNEHLRGLAPRSILFANPEWLKPEFVRPIQRNVERVIAKTRDAERSLKDVFTNVTYTGFIAEDHYRSDVDRMDAVLHVGGNSGFRGTNELLACYREYRYYDGNDLPALTCITNSKLVDTSPVPGVTFAKRVTDDELITLQNSHRFHATPSSYEGYGQALHESQGVGAVLLTTGAGPMDELGAPFTVRATRGKRFNLGDLYEVDVCDLREKLGELAGLSEYRVAAISGEARARFEYGNKAATEAITKLISGIKKRRLVNNLVSDNCNKNIGAESFSKNSNCPADGISIAGSNLETQQFPVAESGQIAGTRGTDCVKNIESTREKIDDDLKLRNMSDSRRGNTGIGLTGSPLGLVKNSGAVLGAEPLVGPISLANQRALGAIKGSHNAQNTAFPGISQDETEEYEENIKIAILGNFRAPHSTENDLLWSLRDMGYTVGPFQEDTDRTEEIVRECKGAALLIYISTHGWQTPGDYSVDTMISRLRDQGTKTASFHLDRYVGLNILDGREDRVGTHPFWRTDLCWTADGGNQDFFVARGIKHRWLPPAVVKRDCYRGFPQENLKIDVGFVGAEGYHPEYSFRPKLIQFLRDVYGERFKVFTGYRGEALNNLYSSIRVVVGDSCFGGADRYWSDRVPETLGRGGFLVHPHCPGLTIPGLVTFAPGDVFELQDKIDYFLAHDVEREACRTVAQAWVKENETYHNRLRLILSTML
jgi:hypothetical protein